MKKIALVAAALLILQTSPVHVSAQGIWQSTLEGRSLDDDTSTIEAYYDKSLNLTWLDAAPIEPMSWDDAKTWAANLNIRGITNWRLPALKDTGQPGCNDAMQGTDCGYNVQTTDDGVIYSEFASLYYDTLGNTGYRSPTGEVQLGWGLQNTGPFKYLTSGPYWLNSEHYYWLGGSRRAWVFSTRMGYQDAVPKFSYQNVLAVHVGDVGTPVPEPSSILLMSLGLALLTGKRISNRLSKNEVGIQTTT